MDVGRREVDCQGGVVADGLKFPARFPGPVHRGAEFDGDVSCPEGDDVTERSDDLSMQDLHCREVRGEAADQRKVVDGQAHHPAREHGHDDLRVGRVTGR
ncbi:hypothetical protein D9M72_638660 [compost metagenome]